MLLKGAVAKHTPGARSGMQAGTAVKLRACSTVTGQINNAAFVVLHSSRAGDSAAGDAGDVGYLSWSGWTSHAGLPSAALQLGCQLGHGPA